MAFVGLRSPSIQQVPLDQCWQVMSCSRAETPTSTTGHLVVFVGLLIARLLRYGLSFVSARMGSEAWGGISLGLARLDILTTLSCLGLLTGRG